LNKLPIFNNSKKEFFWIFGPWRHRGDRARAGLEQCTQIKNDAKKEAPAELDKRKIQSQQNIDEKSLLMPV